MDDFFNLSKSFFLSSFCSCMCNDSSRAVLRGTALTGSIYSKCDCKKRNHEIRKYCVSYNINTFLRLSLGFSQLVSQITFLQFYHYVYNFIPLYSRQWWLHFDVHLFLSDCALIIKYIWFETDRITYLYHWVSICSDNVIIRRKPEWYGTFKIQFVVV